MITSDITFAGTNKNLESKRLNGKSHKSLRDLSCVTANTSKGTTECIIISLSHSLPMPIPPINTYFLLIDFP